MVKTRELFIAACLFFVLLAIFGWMASPAFGLKFSLTSDYAGDMLLANRIRDEGTLLVGHYSRWGFNHPGPFWFYLNHLVEKGFAWTGASRYVLWILGSVVANAIFIAFSSLALSRHVLGRTSLSACCLSALVVVSLVGSDLISLWMPQRLVAPYLAFFACLLHLASGNYRYLAIGALLSGILIHGYATMPLFTVPLLLGCTAIGWMSTRNRRNPAGLAVHAAFALCIAALFALPILRDALSPGMGNLSRLLAAQKVFAHLSHPSWDEMREFVLRLVFERNGLRYLLAVPVILVLLMKARLERKLMQKGADAAVLFLVISFMMILYYRTTPAPIYPFVAQFYAGLPAALLSCVLMAVAYAKNGEGAAAGVALRRPTSRLLVLLTLICLLFPVRKLPAPDEGLAVQSLARYIAEHRQSGQMTAIDYAKDGEWPFIAGLLLELDRIAVPGCTTWQSMGLLYTQKHVCRSEMLPAYLVVESGGCEGACLIEAGGYGLRSVRNALVRRGEQLPYDSPRLFFWNWYGPEKEAGLRWSAGTVSSIRFLYADGDDGASPATLTLKLSPHGVQRFRLALNGIQIYSGKAESPETILNMPLPSGSLRTGENILHFDTPDALAPASELRVLALAFKSLALH